MPAPVASPSVLVLPDPARVGLTAAEIVANRLRARPGLRLLLPTGHTPRGMYAALRAYAARDSLPTADATAFQLDEYLGLGADDPRSFRASLDREIGSLGFGRRLALDGAAADPEAEADRYQALLDEGRVDLAILGIGRDGHVAFNEPGAVASEGVHRVALAPSTLDAVAGEFGGRDRVPREALTVGLRTVRAAREVLLLAGGPAKAGALRAMLEDEPGPSAPASLLRDHPCLTVVCEPAAARRLTVTGHPESDHLVVVLGHREPGVSAEHRISAHSRARLFRAQELCLVEPVRAAVLTGFTHTGGLSEAEQMAREWTLAEVPTVLEVAGRNTAENASRSLPLILALGGVRRVTVVTSAWHLRAPYFFAPYRRWGLRLDVAHARPLRGWRHLLAEEVAGLRSAPRQRLAARSAVEVLAGEPPG